MPAEYKIDPNPILLDSTEINEYNIFCYRDVLLQETFCYMDMDMDMGRFPVKLSGIYYMYIVSDSFFQKII